MKNAEGTGGGGLLLLLPFQHSGTMGPLPSASPSSSPASSPGPGDALQVLISHEENLMGIGLISVRDGGRHHLRVPKWTWNGIIIIACPPLPCPAWEAHA